MKALAALVGMALLTASASAMITDPTCSGILHGVASNVTSQPVPGIRLTLWPIGVDLGYILPTTTTNEGEYWFEHVCEGRFTVVVDDEQTGYPPAYWSDLLGYKHEARLTPENPRIELPVAVPPKAASLKVIARNSRTNAAVPTLRVMLRTSKVKMYDWVTINHDPREPLLLPANTDLLCRVVAKGYREWQGGRKRGEQIRLGPESHLTLNVELEPLR
jgi:hypothetical protein